MRRILPALHGWQLPLVPEAIAGGHHVLTSGFEARLSICGCIRCRRPWKHCSYFCDHDGADDGLHRRGGRLFPGCQCAYRDADSARYRRIDDLQGCEHADCRADHHESSGLFQRALHAFGSLEHRGQRNLYGIDRRQSCASPHDRLGEDADELHENCRISNT